MTRNKYEYDEDDNHHPAEPTYDELTKRIAELEQALSMAFEWIEPAYKKARDSVGAVLRNEKSI